MKVFEFDARKGSYIDQVSGAVGTNTSGKFARAEKGVAWKGARIYSILQWVVSFNLAQDWSANIAYKPSKEDLDSGLGNWLGLFVVAGVGAQYTDGFAITTNRLVYNDGVPVSHNYNNPLTKSEWYNIQVTHDVGSKTVSVYINGEFDVSGTYTGALKTGSHISIGYQATGAASTSGFSGVAQLYDHILTEKERAKLYNEFLNSHPITRSVH